MVLGLKAFYLPLFVTMTTTNYWRTSRWTSSGPTRVHSCDDCCCFLLALFVCLWWLVIAPLSRSKLSALKFLQGFCLDDVDFAINVAGAIMT